MGIFCPDMDKMNPFPELQLPRGTWISLQYHPLSSDAGNSSLLVQMTDVTETKKLIAQVEASQKESAQIRAIAETPELFKDFLRGVRETIENVKTSAARLDFAAAPVEFVNEMFRGIHTIKGIAGAMGMPETVVFAGYLEDSLGRARNQEKIGEDLVAEIKSGSENLEKKVEETRKLATLIFPEEELAASVPVLRISLEKLKHLENCFENARLSEALHNEACVKLRELQQTPAGKGLERITRLAPGLAAQLNKKINFTMQGETTLLPYELAQKLSEPLIHMLRNAFDHGIEGEDQRIAAGKLETGSVKVSAGTNGQCYEISIEDDGKGLDPEVLRQSAVRKGILSPESADSLSSEECLNLIFRPGFTTAGTVSEISGRGVGMDAVQVAIAKMAGSIIIDSVPGKGCRFTIRIPS
ncbi:MAG: hypothetical protein A2W80_12570 [Candidatus Riflebacteria bacterium GWC2_50_8]|nr:MAG: hypothetical protein A2W80_12570 [Candidatus Riflebacteria bacterium GWC2_50_8]